jgi:hypothetical protein
MLPDGLISPLTSSGGNVWQTVSRQVNRLTKSANPWRSPVSLDSSASRRFSSGAAAAS